MMKFGRIEMLEIKLNSSIPSNYKHSRYKTRFNQQWKFIDIRAP